MRKIFSALLVLVLLTSTLIVSASAAMTATPTSSTVLVNNQSVSFDAYTINSNNYFKLRDLAQAVNGTEKQFEVGWDGANNAISLTTGKSYTPVGGELTKSGLSGAQSATLSTSAVYIDGVKVDLTAYTIGGFNYFKLRDIAGKIDFGVGWDGSANTITIDTSVSYTPEASALKNLVVHYIDVGQADSIFIELPNNETLLIDAGNEENGPQIVNYIKALGYNKINYLVATHPHADHIGGMAYVVNNLTIGAIYMPKVTTTTQTYADLLTAIASKGLTVTTAKAGVSLININDFKVVMLAPNKDQYDDLNNYSAVIKITYKNNSFLFMGDAEELSENEITGDVSADVLKVGHHGSSSSTSQTFLNKVNPKYAVISVGADNDYGHPAQTTLDKLTAIGATIFRTDKDGTVIFTSDGTNITVNKVSSTATGSGDDSNSTANSSSKVIISNVDKVAEIVTIKNTGTSDVNLSGWVLVSVTGNQRYTFPSYSLKAGASVTVASGTATGDLKWTTSNMWNNSSSDPAQLYDSTGNLVSTFGS